MRMHVLKDLAGNLCGTFAYVDDSGKLVVGEKTERGREVIFEGSVETFINSNKMQDLTKTDLQLALIISGYYTRQKFKLTDKETQEAANMNKMEKLISNLQKHSYDYYNGNTQDFEQVAKDCLAAADKLYMFSNSEIADIISTGVQKEKRTDKLCEIKVTEGAESFKELVFQLTANGYSVDAAPVYKEFPKTGLDYWMIAIFDKE